MRKLIIFSNISSFFFFEKQYNRTFLSGCSFTNEKNHQGHSDLDPHLKWKHKQTGKFNA